VTIKNPAAYLASIWDWAPLRPCFKRGIEPTDIDGFVEIGGYFLVIEGKAPGVPLKEGQRLMFERMHRWNKTIPGLFTMIVIWGDAATHHVEQAQFWPTDPFACDWDSFQSYVSAWAESAEERAAIQEEESHHAFAGR
jgi:hypothetical protein